jgi:hypothetical protein
MSQKGAMLLNDVALLTWLELALVHALRDTGRALDQLFAFGKYVQTKFCRVSS